MWIDLSEWVKKSEYICISCEYQIEEDFNNQVDRMTNLFCGYQPASFLSYLGYHSMRP